MIRVLRVRFFEYGKWNSLVTKAQFNTLELAKEYYKNYYLTDKILLDYEEC